MRINRKIVVSLNIRTSKDGEKCEKHCYHKYSNIGLCHIYGALEGHNIRHPKCIKDEVTEDYYEKRKK